MSRSMMLVEMKNLVRALPPNATQAHIAEAVVEDNVLEKPTLSSRKKSLRHLSELYGLDRAKALFRVFWDFAKADPDSLPQLCLVLAYARDPQLRHSFDLVRRLRSGETLGRAVMEEHIEGGYPMFYEGPLTKYFGG